MSHIRAVCSLNQPCCSSWHTQNKVDYTSGKFITLYVHMNINQNFSHIYLLVSMCVSADIHSIFSDLFWKKKVYGSCSGSIRSSEYFISVKRETVSILAVLENALTCWLLVILHILQFDSPQIDFLFEAVHFLVSLTRFTAHSKTIQEEYMTINSLYHNFITTL